MLIGNILAFPHSVAAPAGFGAPATYFDGSTTLASSQWGPASDGVTPYAAPATGTQGRKYTVSFWIRRDAAVATDLIGSATGKVRLILSATGVITVSVRNSASTLTINRATTAGVPLDGAWHHVLLAWNLETPVFQAYIDGVNVAPAAGTLTQFGQPMMSDGVWSISTGGFLTGCLAEFFVLPFHTDLSVQANRELFRTAAGTPATIPDNGVVGGRPLFFLRGAGASFIDPTGGGAGYFTVSAGSLSAC